MHATDPKIRSAANALLQHAAEEIGRIILGKDDQIRLALTCLVARGHLLIEDLPGMGKTTLSHALAHVLGLSYSRVQFTSDLLPADILGVSIFDQESNAFSFHPGPVFTQVLLADGSQSEVVWEGLTDRGLSTSVVEKVMGKNLRRVYSETIG